MVAHTSQNTAIVVSSNGAIHALYVGLQRSDIFGLVGCQSLSAAQSRGQLLDLRSPH